jgi:hypothetical protein
MLISPDNLLDKKSSHIHRLKFKRMKIVHLIRKYLVYIHLEKKVNKYCTENVPLKNYKYNSMTLKHFEQCSICFLIIIDASSHNKSLYNVKIFYNIILIRLYISN